MDKAEILALRMGRMTKVGILALVDKGGITVPQAFNLLYQQGREDAIDELLKTLDDCDFVGIERLVTIAEMVKEKK